MLQVENFLIDLEKSIGQGQFGKVFLAIEIIDEQKSRLVEPTADKYQTCACKVIDRTKLSQNKENLINSEIMNQNAIASKYVVRVRKVIKTEIRYFMFIDYSNFSDLKELMDNKKMLSPAVVQRIICQLVRAINDMTLKNVIHRDIKLRNIMIHCPMEPNDKLLGEGQYQEEVDQEESNVDFDHKDAANEIEFSGGLFPTPANGSAN
jgi:serine/threonine protein kinase